MQAEDFIQQYMHCDPAGRKAMFSSLISSESLNELLSAYNWDDGLNLPADVANHPSCDLGTALNLFWLAEGVEAYLNGQDYSAHQRSWVEFCKELAEKILANHYAPGPVPFVVPVGVSKRHMLRKQGVPEVFLSDTPATASAIER